MQAELSKTVYGLDSATGEGEVEEEPPERDYEIMIATKQTPSPARWNTPEAFYSHNCTEVSHLRIKTGELAVRSSLVNLSNFLDLITEVAAAANQ